MLLMFLRKQKEDEKEDIQRKSKSNLRKNENYNRSYAFGYIRELSVLKYESVLYISPNKTFLPITHYLDNGAVIRVEGYDNILSHFDDISLNVTEEKDYVLISALSNSGSQNGGNKKKDFRSKNTNIICVNKEDSYETCARINTVVVDKSLFKTVKISSCDSETINACFFVFVQLDKRMCFNFTNLSYSCHSTNLKNKNTFVINNSCYVVLASSKIDVMYDFIRKLLSSKNFNEATKTEGVEIITHFCGNVLNQVATIDANNVRLLFIQRYIHFMETTESPSNSKETEKGERQKGGNELNDVNNFFATESEETQTNNDIKKYDIKNNKFLRFRENYYITVIDLFSENKEIIEYVNYSKMKPHYTLFPPLYIGCDEQINIYYIINYENSGVLNFVFLSTDTLSIYYTLRVQDFYSGWMLKSFNTQENKGLMLLGEYAPYEDELHVWNVSNFHHNRYFVNTLKADMNI